MTYHIFVFSVSDTNEGKWPGKKVGR